MKTAKEIAKVYYNRCHGGATLTEKYFIDAMEEYASQQCDYKDKIIKGLSKQMDALQETIEDFGSQQQPSRKKIIEIDFDGHCKTKIEVTNDSLIVLAAMNGRGNGISLDNITVSELTETKEEKL